MAIGFLTASESHTGTTGNTSSASFTWNHASAGTPKGVVVFVHQVVTVTSNLCTGVTYGGTAMTSLGTYVTDAAGEPGSVQAYFLGASVPTGTQAVVVSRTNNAVAMYASCMTFSAIGDTSTAGYTSVGGDQTGWTGLTIDDGTLGQNSMRVCAIYTGAAAPLTAGSGTTAPTSIDFGAYGISMYYQTTPTQGSYKVLVGTVTDDVAAIGFSVIENGAYVSLSTSS